MTDDEWRTREACIAAEDARLDRLAAAERAVVKTGLAWWRSGYDDPQKGEEFDAACATLAKLEAK